ncbi:ammonium transporter Amt1 [Exophiala dermatitidis]|uniref:Ammonium transporter n=3 Tax=Exophiala dermatitidis TaxID=5970 RepID=H6BXB6_EXODN|nr:amt family ammonium transporter [Exophiala dermatitidis NIH/UT8656]KAJ4505274.1 ammonium transporter Amt1 [Exophiala dermatitidis]EHY56218.1 amt family ammonium transporter [Exophiala dermatitidis NIH/UT8656]KAJ4505733.1 ammonium transporter Amt1 [Exophiala dermatitidis]KAJ4536339.1 ammonium transporter Amt1 [Exophiala dermatitidis]KAJ4541132.1 ammonium transporter Amt1 [Exophiala dermatitidis]
MSDSTDSLPYVPLEPYEGTSMTGGNSLTEDLNVYYNAGDIAWMITATALVLLMIPGVGFFYSGLARRKSALSLIWLSVAATGLISFQWFFWGYSLAFSHTAGKFLGDMENFGFRNVLGAPSIGSTKIPDLMFAVYQGMFAAITVALAIGAAAERGRMLPAMVFSFVWSTVVYDPIACWTWNSSGWVFKMGGLDFAGGTPVHISSGAAALAYSLMLGKRRGHGTHELNYRPHNVTHIVIGTVFLWVGWFGFNAGSALAANLRAVMAAVVTNLAASVGGITWCILDYRLERKWSTVGFCSGVIAGLVAITPGSGFVPAWAAVIFGVVGGVACNYATKLKFLLRIDDSLDIFALHGVGGLVGDLLTGLFAADYIAHLDGSMEIPGGWINHHYIQLAYQLCDGVTGMAYSFVLSCLILFVINLIPGLHIRASEQEEIMGMDETEIGEFAYDYVELSRDVVNGIESSAASQHKTTPISDVEDADEKPAQPAPSAAAPAA